MDELTLVLANHHPLMRAGLRLLLETRPDCRVIGEADTGPEVLALVRRLEPAILIVTVALPASDGLDITRAVGAEMPRTRVILLATDLDEGHAQAALRAGAAAYVLMESCPGDFFDAITQVAAGRRYLSPPLAERALRYFARPQPGAAAAPSAALSPRERHVLALVAQGLTSAAIAHRLSLGVRTVEWHRAQLLRKLGLRSTVALVRYALEHRLLLDVG